MQETSLRAYFNEIHPRLGERQQEVLAAFVLGARDWTNSELSQCLRKPINTITPRVFELRAAGLVEEAGKRICKVTGRKVLSWRRVQKVEAMSQPRVAVPLFNR